jgi:hypothetical protein
MVERVARGSIVAPAAVALGAATLGLMAPLPAVGGQETTLQIRVQVVEACQIRLAPSGQLGELCPWSGGLQPLPTVEMPSFNATLPDPDGWMTPWPAVAPLPSPKPIAGGFDDANRRALGLAQEIAQRVRYVTLTF